ncbi:uncharacterized protein At5g39570 isoform X2 [Telopea speciosissima]|uniref:uncharacterized protein At5g39570 isoform X2 n=1 Tax=Telopea speciosissima TaxID=54955 RepID=UPI001CC3D024|nr:uncharacterized protein At5g39570 isoform X2 [Telopea speciosissima]
MDGYTYLSNLVYSPQPNFSTNSLWEWELNQESYRSKVYYNISEFNVPEFEEFDPTPYGGGYDQALTYGKPLPPSDAICYPLSIPQPTEPISPPPLQVPTNGSTNLPNGGEEEVEHSKSPPNRKKSTEEDQPSYGGEEIFSHGDYGVPGNGFDSGYEYPLDSFYPGWSDYNYGDGYGRQEPQTSWSDCGYDYGYGSKELEPQAPEYGICASLFGYWPCLSEKEKEQRKQIGEEQCYGNQWSSTADFLFGSMYPYGERRDNGEVNSGYERYYQEQHNYKQKECNVPLWVQNGSYYQASPSHYIDGEDSYWEDSYNQSKYYDE